jgi:pyruvate/2-oxoglutarate dehydrogenase complex dihydrolipoamide acyltransferase (E2) component
MTTTTPANYDVKLPDIGEGVAEGEIVRWLVKQGDAVREDQPLVEVMTDKASVEIPSPRTGTIAALHVEEGAMVPVGTVLVSIAVARGGAAPAAAPAGAHAHAGSAAKAIPAATSAASVPPAGARPRVDATPAVRALAKELGVALERVRGSGPGGRISADDVRAAASVAKPAPALPNAPAATTGPEAQGHANDETRLPLRGLRRRIAEHMRRSLSTAAQFTFVAECDFTALVEHRARAAARAQAAGIKLTFLAYLFRALPLALREFPLLNSSLDDETHEIVLKRRFHLGLATNTDEGLTVPIVHDADRLGLFALAREIERLAAAARGHKLKLEELQGGTFTVTSTGAKGGVLATPILHHPQVAILGLHAVTQKPAVVGGQIVVRDLGNLSLSLDHRVVDGAVGADFLYALITRLENPTAWLTEGDSA